jgi:hypothetical protein
LFGEMRRRRSHIFTPEALQTLRRLANERKSASEIAAAIGSTAASVRVRCCQLKIKLTQRARADVPRSRHYHVQEQKLIVGVPPAVYAALARKAAGMQKSTDELARMLLEAVVSSDIYEAVLDADE